MQADEIDRIMAGILRDVGARAEHHTHAEIAYLIRSALRSAGLSIITINPPRERPPLTIDDPA